MLKCGEKQNVTLKYNGNQNKKCPGLKRYKTSSHISTLTTLCCRSSSEIKFTLLHARALQCLFPKVTAMKLGMRKPRKQKKSKTWRITWYWDWTSTNRIPSSRIKNKTKQFPQFHKMHHTILSESETIGVYHSLMHHGNRKVVPKIVTCSKVSQVDPLR